LVCCICVPARDAADFCAWVVVFFFLPEQPAAGITPAMFGAPVSEQEAEDLSKR
jgi:hypothetical protein